MKDSAPILLPSAPPSYTEAISESCNIQTNPSVGNSVPSDPPPSYPPLTNAAYTGTYHAVTSGPGYQRFDHCISLVQLGPDSCFVQCPTCGHEVMTDIHHRAGTLTFITAGLCFFLCIVCTFLPFCMDDLQDVTHTCPICKHHIGTYSRI
ncbi:lipopolysaccharide-induced tumor necrosis factor-alpha factor-like [Physella acuta]|uniref:lipopolysaccharide-induced tumor necrosis factor-alpha factor-like n=1 Tax=Physella acuta TaxID=109671 RepID=UPI0027DE4DF4|nr:lipopolysaccharide-induced tumor necrosis factor-alpha factor-like [Physella acuta]XP_059148517.1 lipopolysaccharide-induced tumor necrosis factor-alpha factor-like [Physella acuta]